MMTIKKVSAKNKILFSILDYLENEGNNKLTSDKIVVIAKVDIAEINYHFGSEYKLLEETLEIFSINNARLFEIY